MEVTKDNFSKAYDILEKSLDDADFIAIDAEFTGLSTIKQGRPGYDTMEENYLKTRKGSGKILLIQYGISLFTWKEKHGHYEAMPFTFYIFPRPYKQPHKNILKYGNDVVFTGQSSSFDFLANNGFDFNKLFYKGISFMTPTEEEKARERMEDEIASYIEEKRMVTVEPSDEQPAKDDTAIALKKVYEEKRQDEEKTLDELIGFSKVMKLITKSQKPIVGHHMLLDLFLTTTNFFSPPPLCLRDFKALVSNLFPVIFDTKCIAISPPCNLILSGTGLGKLIENIEKEKLPQPKVVISQKLKDEVGYSQRYHQAGYDAYCTGRLFISLAKYVLTGLNRIDLSCDLLNPYINRVFILGIRDIAFIDLSGEDSTPDRRDVFYVRFPVSWTQANIEDLFTPFCSLNYPINWINEESAFITITDKRNYDDVFANLVMNSGNEFYVLPYHDYINNKYTRNRVCMPKETVPTKRKRSHSDLELMQ